MDIKLPLQHHIQSLMGRATGAQAQTIPQFFVFAGVGAVGTLGHYMLLVTLVQLFSVRPLIGSICGFILGAFINYYLNYHITFRSKKRHPEAMIKFFLIAAVGFFLNGLFMYFFNEILTFHYLLSQVLTTALVLIWTFTGNKVWTFREVSHGQ